MSSKMAPCSKLRKALRESMKACGGFSQLPHIRDILSHEQVRQLLVHDESGTESQSIMTADEIVSKTEPSYLTVLAILILMEKSRAINQFIAAGIDDGYLPFQYDEENEVLLARDSMIEFTSYWNSPEKDLFINYQKKLTVPFLKTDAATDAAMHYYFSTHQWLPWHDGLEKQEQKRAGGFSTVYRIQIAPRCHGFEKVLERVGLDSKKFALKILTPDPKKRAEQEQSFKNEIRQLHNFNGTIHKNLITILASYEVGNSYHFVFPWAECDLSEYWQNIRPNPDPRDTTTVLWFAQQFEGIAAALHAIHNPTNIKKYGRHGDLKAGNILYYERANNRGGILVIADMGLTVVNGTNSRSKVPKDKVTPGHFTYQAPEIDVEGATISRAYDVWTLGCIFLEMIVWLVSGFEGHQKFEGARETTHGIDGWIVANFYDIVTLPKGDSLKPELQKHGIMVKNKVIDQYDEIRKSPNSSRFVHDMLNIIQDEMILVLSRDEKQKRAPSERIMKGFAEICRNCTDKGPDYYQKHFFEPRGPERNKKYDPVEIEFTQDAQSTIRKKRPSFSHYPGAFQSRLSAKEYKELEPMDVNTSGE